MIIRNKIGESKKSFANRKLKQDILKFNNMWAIGAVDSAEQKHPVNVFARGST